MTEVRATTLGQPPAPVRDLAVPGLPPDLRVRTLDPSADFPALAEFMADVNLADGHNQVLTPEEVALEWRRSPGFEPTRDALLVEDDAGIVAHLNVDAQVRDGKVLHWMEGWVRRDRRRRGIGRALLRWAERHAAEHVRDRVTPEPDLPQFLGFGVVDTNPAALAFAASTGYARVRYGFQMRRPLDLPIPDIDLPAGIELRPVREADHRRIWEADVEAFRDHHEPREPTEDDFVAAFTYPDIDTTLWRVAWEDDEVVGSVMNSIFPVENARLGINLGWLEHVSVRRPWRGRGVAKALIVSSLHAHRERGMDAAALGVDADNPTGALGLYEGLGFRPHQRWISHRRPLDVAAELEERT